MINTVGQTKAMLLEGKNYKDWISDIGAKQELKLKDAVSSKSETGEVQQSFQEILLNSVGKVNELQKDANTAIEALASGRSKNLHETLLRVEAAEVAFKSMNQIRLKVIDAYREVMRMQI